MCVLATHARVDLVTVPDADRQVQSPSGNQIYSSNRESQGSFSTAAASPGRYTYCFNNHGSPTSAKTVR